MKIRLEIDTDEPLSLSSAYELLAGVIKADQYCRAEHGPPKGESQGDWVYGWDEANTRHTLHYSVSITE